jgi:hypothetical protein
MRKEFFRYFFSPAIASLWVIYGMFWGGFLIWGIHTEKLFPPEMPYARAEIGFAVVFWVVWMAMAAGQPLLRNWSRARPLIIIDDSGLWLRRYDELMRWSEIQWVEWEWLGQDARFTIVWRHKPFRVGRRLLYMDIWTVTGTYGGRIPSTRW